MRYEILKYCSARECYECDIDRVYDPRPGECIGKTNEETIEHYNVIKKPEAFKDAIQVKENN